MAKGRATTEESVTIPKISLEQLLAKTDINFKSVMKLYFQWIVLIFFHVLLFFYLPIHGNFKTSNQGYCDLSFEDQACNNFNLNNSLITFYLLCCGYFWISALQVKQGLPEVMQNYFMMGKYHWFNKLIFTVFMNIPFIFELRIFIDWTYTKTSLDVFQWIKLAQCQADLYKAKCIQKGYFEKPLGEKIPKYMKYLIGFSMIVVIVVLLIGPMFLFSSFNFLGDLNPVSKAEIDFSLNIQSFDNQQNAYKLFSTSNIQKKNDTLNEESYDEMGFQNNSRTKINQPEQVQYLIMNYQPQETWIISEPIK